MKAVKVKFEKQNKLSLIQLQLFMFIFYKPACLQKHFQIYVSLFMRVFSSDRH